MSVEVYQGKITITNADTYQQAVKEIFSMAGYNVTPDATNHKVTVENGGNVVGHGTFDLGSFKIDNSLKLVMVIDKDQHVLIVSQDAEINDIKSSDSFGQENKSFRSIACMIVGDYDRGRTVDDAPYGTVFNIADVTVSRVAGQPCIVTPCIDWGARNLSPIFIAANGVWYPLGTYVTDGSTKFVSNGNGLLIKVKE